MKLFHSLKNTISASDSSSQHYDIQSPVNNLKALLLELFKLEYLEETILRQQRDQVVLEFELLQQWDGYM